jgi:hypothetical protein
MGWHKPQTATPIDWDIAGYYLYLPTLCYDNLANPQKVDSLRAQYHLVQIDHFYIIKRLPNGKIVMKYSYGMALMYLPGFVAGHVMAVATGYARDGFSWPYQYCMSLWALIFSLFGLWVLRRVMLRYFSDIVVALAIFFIAVGSNYFDYVAYQTLMSHSFMFVLLAAIILLTDNWYKNPKPFTALAMGALCGLATVSRPSDMLFMSVPVLWALPGLNRQAIAGRLSFFWKHAGHLVLFAAAVAIMGSIQCLYWKMMTGHYVFWSYDDYEGFDFAHPHIYKGLFSIRKGWLIYTPLMLCALAGLWPLYKKNKAMALFIVLFTCINIYIVFSWRQWWYGAAFTARPMIDSYALLIFPLAALLEGTLRKRLWAIITLLICSTCSWINQAFTYNYIFTHDFFTDDMNITYFWHMLGKLNINDADRKYADTNEELPGQWADKLATFYETGFEYIKNPQTPHYQGPGCYGMRLNDSIQFTPEIKRAIPGKAPGWIRAYAYVYYEGNEGDLWKYPQFTICLYHDRNRVKAKMMRINRLCHPGRLTEVTVEIEAEKNLQADSVGIYFWNPGSKLNYYINHLRVAGTMK